MVSVHLFFTSTFPWCLILDADTIIFSSSDAIALVVQGLGGAAASRAVLKNEDLSNVSRFQQVHSSHAHPNRRGHIWCWEASCSKWVRSVCEQSNAAADSWVRTVSITAAAACAAEFFVRFIADKPVRNTPIPNRFKDERSNVLDTRTKVMVAGLMFSMLCIFIRYFHRPPNGIPLLTTKFVQFHLQNNRACWRIHWQNHRNSSVLQFVMQPTFLSRRPNFNSPQMSSMVAWSPWPYAHSISYIPASFCAARGFLW
jgi:hypothetical protein